MPTNKRTCLYLALARRSCSLLAGLALASNTIAMGLGGIEGSSYLGQPLKALINVEMGNDDYSPDEVRVGQIGAAEAQRLGIDIIGSYQNYVLTPVTRNGRLMIDLSTREPVNEPYLNIVVELRWPEGRVFREYSLLLDPVSYNSAVQTVALPPTAANSPQTAVTAPATHLPARAAQTSNKSDAALSGGQSYQVLPGDSLSKIAARMTDAGGRSRQQLMAILLANNPRAFIGGDQNRLMAGARLYLPTDSELQTEADFQPRAEAQARPQPQIQPVPTAQAASEATKQIAAEPERLTVFTSSDNAAQRFDGPNSQAGVIAKLSDQLAVTNEIIEKLRLDNESMRSRLVMLEKSDYQQNLEQLLLLKDKEIEALTLRLASKEGAVAPAEPLPVTQASDPVEPVAKSTSIFNIALKGLFGLCLLGAVFFLTRMRKARQSLDQKTVPPVSDEVLLQELEEAIDSCAAVDSEPQPLAREASHTTAAAKSSSKPVVAVVPPSSPMARNRRPDDEVKSSIQQKMSTYQPQLKEQSGVENYELDELVEDAIGMANRGSFDVAEAILMAEYSEQSRQTGIIDVKLKHALDTIAAMRKGQKAGY